MTKTNKRDQQSIPGHDLEKLINKIGIAALIVLLIILVISIFAPHPAHKVVSAKSQSSAVFTKLPYSTSAEKTKTAEATAGALGKFVAADIQDQIPPAEVSKILVSQNLLSSDPMTGKPAKVAVFTFTKISPKLDVNKNIKTVTTALNQLNETQKTDWVFAQASKKYLETTGAAAALKAWDESKNPQNPSIIEISYTENPVKPSNKTFTFEIDISATVY